MDSIKKIPLDIYAGLFELSGLWLVGNRNKTAFIIFLICDLIWIYFGLKKKVYGLLLVCIPSLIISVRNYMLWDML